MIAVPTEVPVDPDAPEATRWLVEELSKPAYQAARPTWFDLVSEAFSDWLFSLRLGSLEGPPALGVGLVVLLVVAGLIVAFLVFGMPRLNRRSTVTGSLFGEDDARSAERIRRDAEAAAAAGDHSTAVIEMFRAIARGLAERTLITTSPGTTARDFAAHTAVVFPSLAVGLRAAAVAFDDTRYLGRTGTAEQYAQIAALETALRAERPRLVPA